MEENLETKNSLISLYGFTDANFEQLTNSNIALENMAHQLAQFNNGISKTTLEKPATITDGIVFLSHDEVAFFTSIFDVEKDNYSLEKFVPASGAASRMFQFLSEFLLVFDAEKESVTQYIDRTENNSLLLFFSKMSKFPFYKMVNDRLAEKYSDFNSWEEDRKSFAFIKLLLDENEFDFCNKPKAILPFHVYQKAILSPIEEHIKEATNYCLSNNNAKLHFTISKEHQTDFDTIISNCDIKDVQITFSEQLKSTDTIVVNSLNQPVKDENNNLIFRPGGHGALIYNLNKLTSDIVFIKNIDNVSNHSATTISDYKKMLAGYLIQLQKQIFNYLTNLDQSETDKENTKIIADFLENNLKIEIPQDFDNLEITEQKSFLHKALNKPIRICGMVKNENEPGGGPFWVKESCGKSSLQIVELSQVNDKNPEQLSIFKTATHFNPVDLVCGLKNYKNQSFDLLQYINHETGFIVEKSKDGLLQKAYELPGLWNGAMHNWITIFIEVPLCTFNPVKTVNDLLKKNHQFEN